jgi:hypothetical protein
MRLRPALIACALLAVPAANLQAALTHRYSFNDGTVNDSVGTAHGVLVNGAAVQNGALVFDPVVNNGFNTSPATGQYVDLPNNIAKTRAFTIESWTTWRGGAAWQRIADFGNNNLNLEIEPSNKNTYSHYGLGFILLTTSNNNGHPIAQISVNSSGGSGDTDLVGAVVLFPQNAEVYVVFSHDPDTGVDALYANGVLLGQTVAQYDHSGMNYVNYWIGRSNFSADPFYNGTFNEYRIYNHGLTGAQVLQNYQLGPNVIPEPGVLSLLAASLLPMLRRHRRRQP